MHHIVSFVSHSTVLQIWQLNGPHVPFQTMPCPNSFTSVDKGKKAKVLCAMSTRHAASSLAYVSRCKVRRAWKRYVCSCMFLPFVPSQG